MSDPFEKRGDRFYIKGTDGDLEVLPDLVPLLKPIGDLKVDPNNPRKTKLLKDLVAGIKQFGIRWQILVNKRTGMIEAGHQRLYAAQELGLTHWPVVWADDDSLTATGFNLSDNRLGEVVAEWDDDVLAVQLKAMLEESEESIIGIGFERDDIDARISEYLDAQGEGGEEPPEPPDPNKVPAVTKSGDIWQCGVHRVCCGDSTDPDVVARLMDGGRADMVFMDPPYGVDYMGKTKDNLVIENDGEEGLADLLRRSIRQGLVATRPGACWYVAAPAGPHSIQFAQALHAAEILRQTLVWVKDSMVLGHSDYHYKHEMIFYGWTPGAAHDAPPDRTQTSVWEIPRPKASREHPTMKPVDLVTKALRNSSQRAGIVLDLFGGSGTTLIAAEQLGRKCMAMEIDPKYCDVICQRYYDLTGVSPVREGDSLKWIDLAKRGKEFSNE